MTYQSLKIHREAAQDAVKQRLNFIPQPSATAGSGYGCEDPVFSKLKIPSLAPDSQAADRRDLKNPASLRSEIFGTF